MRIVGMRKAGIPSYYDLALQPMQTAKIRMRCPVCGKKLSASPEKEGKLAHCPHCGDTIRIVSMPEAAIAAAAPAPEPTRPPESSEDDVPEAAPVEDDALDVGPIEDEAPEAAFFEDDEPLTLEAMATPAPRAAPSVHPDDEETSLHDPDEDMGPVDVPVAAGGGLRMTIILGFPILLVVGLLGGYVLAGLNGEKPTANGGAENQPPAPEISPDERQRRENERAYIKRVQVVRFEVGRTDLREHALLGEVRNVGGEILEQVKIVARCLSDGAPIEQELWVVDASASRVGHQAHPLQPGQTREFVMDLQDMSEAWGGQVQVEVTEVRFRKPPAPSTGG